MNFIQSRGIAACEAKAQELAAPALYSNVLNFGGGHDSNRWEDCFNLDGLKDTTDFNTGAIGLPDETFDLVVCEQVIEHLHNTTWALHEMRRLLMPGGYLILSTENLASWPNRLALLFGMTPFSCQPMCGQYVGGFKTGIIKPTDDVAMNDPRFSGIKGHVRVMTKGQLREVLELCGFEIVETHSFALGHYILFYCKKV